MTVVNNKQATFLKLTQVRSKYINTLQISNNRILNNSTSLKSDDSKEVKYEIDGDLSFDELEGNNSKLSDKKVQKYADSKTEVENIKKEIATIESTIENLNSLKSSQESKLSKIEKVYKNAINSSQKSALKTAMETAQRAIDSLDKQIEAEQTKLAKAKKALSEA